MDKRELLYKLINEKLWKNLSDKEIRLYLFLIVISDKEEGSGKLNLKEINFNLGFKFNKNDIEKAMEKLQKLNLISIASLKKYTVKFILKSP
ncbi:hypothetical protein J7K97_01855 [Candidatus Aerophobetes bacterium]|nr:hypothetical protein [Candidatus Aerophobetes bacterium]